MPWWARASGEPGVALLVCSRAGEHALSSSPHLQAQPPDSGSTRRPANFMLGSLLAAASPHGPYASLALRAGPPAAAGSERSQARLSARERLVLSHRAPLLGECQPLIDLRSAISYEPSAR